MRTGSPAIGSHPAATRLRVTQVGILRPDHRRGIGSPAGPDDQMALRRAISRRLRRDIHSSRRSRVSSRHPASPMGRASADRTQHGQPAPRANPGRRGAGQVNESMPAAQPDSAPARPAFPTPFAVVGAGRLGTAIAGALRGSGVRVTGPHGRGYDGRAPDGRIDAVVLLCVPDDAIGPAADLVVPGPLLGHCSGVSTLEVLGDRAAFSMHPLLTVTGAGTEFQGAWAAVAGSNQEAIGVAEELAGVLGLRAVQVADTDRAAYHAAASFAANFLVTVESAAAELMATTGLDRAVLLPLARAALENWGRLGPPALTGPVARGDTGTVARHRAVIQSRTPELAELFEALVAATERLGAQRLIADPIQSEANSADHGIYGAHPGDAPQARGRPADDVESTT
jgi:predicted short-subunit dehydrogenase-like oxidoreductase (DUF2520 family)